MMILVEFGSNDESEYKCSAFESRNIFSETNFLRITHVGDPAILRSSSIEISSHD